ncbi:hypothetical protein MAC_09182 [Metarhizium acridum CQMa 102]|uniref:Carbohydrate-binding module family 96 domain-containing protein n=1 Tax=Metarhizium acridum (strain CQMa 102) TaxID=655827 RepID=E9EH34_METAQ|nr:uncharacterized protein MAC_09182 [Metarhizium acridum CQMa 102]EFY84779.1 hypothetical protein MAC_09182 [Metarhizium acridum CQMa 102]
MKLVNLLKGLLLAASIPASHAEIISTLAIKDSTILRSTVSCADCPDRNCYECTLGQKMTLEANTGGLAYIRMLIGFHVPVEPSRITQCTVRLGTFTSPLEYSVNVTVAQAVSSQWSEDTVTGQNAPDSGDPFNSIAVRPHTEIGSIDITQACKNAAGDGQFSIYVGKS